MIPGAFERHAPSRRGREVNEPVHPAHRKPFRVGHATHAILGQAQLTMAADRQPIRPVSGAVLNRERIVLRTCGACPRYDEKEEKRAFHRDSTKSMSAD